MIIMNKKENLKKRAAEKSLEFIKSGMFLGLGTGSTVYFVLEALSKSLKNGALLNIQGIPSSTQTQEIAHKFGIPLTGFDKIQKLHLTIDGADEVDENMNLIKGGGGALLREKVIAQASERVIIIVDESKISASLGEKWAVPIEVIPFAYKSVINLLSRINGKALLRKGSEGNPFITDENNYILDTNFGIITEPDKLSIEISKIAGVVEHGIFSGIATDLITAYKDEIKHSVKPV